MSLSGVPFLELACPPQGYRTTGALVTTYSADLFACLALLVAFDGSASERPQYNKIEAMRALERLRNSVRILVQQSRIEWHGQGNSKVLGLLNSVLRTVPFDGRKRSFHPKVVVARQECSGSPDRYVLSVGSRNLTASGAWDLGLGLVGYARTNPPSGTRRLEGLARFINRLGALIGEPGLGHNLGRVDDVCWELPNQVDRIAFHFHPGTPRGIHQTELVSLPSRGRALLISPFLNVDMVKKLATHLSDADDIRLVSSKMHLD
jgi:hypothetical protein